MIGTMNFAQAASPLKETKVNKEKLITVRIPKKVRLATVILMPTGVRFNRMMGEEQLIDLGCTFETDDSSSTTKLINILKDSNIRIATDADDQREFEPREGIYLMTESGSRTKLLFGRAYTDGDHVFGTFTQSGVIEQFVIGKQTLPKELFDWAATIGNPVSKARGNDQLECDLFMKKSGYYEKLH